MVAPAHTSLFVVRTPKANASLVSLKDYEVRLGVRLAVVWFM